MAASLSRHPGGRDRARLQELVVVDVEEELEEGLISSYEFGGVAEVRAIVVEIGVAFGGAGEGSSKGGSFGEGRVVEGEGGEGGEGGERVHSEKGRVL